VLPDIFLTCTHDRNSDGENDEETERKPADDTNRGNLILWDLNCEGSYFHGAGIPWRICVHARGTTHCDSIKSAIRRTIICLHRRRVFSRLKTPLFLSRKYWGDNFVEGFARVIARPRVVSGVLGQNSLPSPPNFSSCSDICVNKNNADIFVFSKLLYITYFYRSKLIINQNSLLFIMDNQSKLMIAWVAA